ncbi:MAG: hypothetical protein JO247_23985, partial [Chloroflexi bacterium]|nr:hypothetical protein [Chloroflexota bacterium]
MAVSSVSRRGLLRLFVSGAGMVVLAACGSATAPASSAPAAAPSSAPPKPSAAASTAASTAASAPAISVSAAAKPSAAPSGQPKLGGTLRFGATADIPNLDGHQRSATLTDTTWTAFDRLIQYDDKGKPQPMLADSWDLAPDYKSITFHLKKGVTFHTGREFTSDDVKWNLLRGKDPKVGSGSYVTWANWVTSIDTPDKYTVALKFDNSRPSIFDWFEYYNMLDSVVMQGPDAQTKLSGTGPFAFQEWKQGTSVSFTKNKNYWDT